MKSIFRKIRERLFNGLARQSDLDTLYTLISGLLQIQNGMEGKPVLRPLRGWAISPDAMAWVLADLQERAMPTVIEFGSGQSTVILASALKLRNGKLLSVEHDPEYSSIIQRQVAACGLSEHVEFLHSPLCNSRDAASIRSYDTSVLPDIPVDIALIDGPPYTNGTLTRLTPIRWAAHHINRGGAIFLDDSARGGEQACLKQLAIEYPNLRQISRNAEKGLIEIREVQA